MAECSVCDKIKEKKALIVYEDDNLIAILPSKPAVPGHIKIMPKQHAAKIEELPDDVVEDLFFLSNFASSSVFEAMRAHGTNIMLNESDSHLCIDVIPRKEGDGLSFTWKPKELSADSMDEAYLKIKDKAFFINKKGTEPKPGIGSAAPTPIIMSDKGPGDETGKGDDKDGSKKVEAGEKGEGSKDDKKEKEEEVIKVPKEDKINYLIKQLQRIP
ncbi:HIT family protein [Candidatus Woesearchaeota archaeon]|nr:HIT family protein [Candidatus Woesearchaeota archaeon]